MRVLQFNNYGGPDVLHVSEAAGPHGGAGQVRGGGPGRLRHRPRARDGPGVGLVLLAEIQRRVVAMTALAVLALVTAVSMWIVSAAWRLALSRPSVRRSPARVTPVLGLASLAFGVWYAFGALTLVP